MTGFHEDTQFKNFLNRGADGSHAIIIGLVGSGKKVLDAGCGSGYLAGIFREHGCFVVGIERGESDARAAKIHCDHIVCADIETLPEPAPSGEFFDVILYADILEHLVNPARVLDFYRRYLKPGGIIIASVPNVARLDIRLKLLFGGFDYEESGILCRHHVRFFTLKTARRLLENAGYDIHKVRYSGIANRIKLFPALCAFQFILVGGKRVV